MSLVDSIAEHLQLPSPIIALDTEWTKQAGITLFIKRDELIHPHICGNKWRKLKFSIVEMESRNKNSIATFGGAYSNHLVAVAAAGHFGKFQTLGIVRSYETNLINPSLDLCREYGMELHFVHPSEYSLIHESEEIKKILHTYPEHFMIPEGGTNQYALTGVEELYQEILVDLEHEPDYVITPIGSGGTFAGLENSTSTQTSVIGLAPFKGEFSHVPGLNYLVSSSANFRILPSGYPDLRFGGYHEGLRNFVNQFRDEHAIQLDPIYTGRAMKKLAEMCCSGYFIPGSTVVFIHTGGLQGIAGYNYQYSKKDEYRN